MKKLIMTLGAAGLLLMFCNCHRDGKGNGNVISGGPGIGTDTATVKMLDSLYADPIEKDEPAPEDKLHSTYYILQRVKTFYKLMDDKQCCSEGYLKLYHQTEELCKQRKTELRKTVLEDNNHWTFEDDDSDPGENWHYEILEVEQVTKNYAHVVVKIIKNYETTLRLHLVMERGDWYVDNFEGLYQMGFDAGVQVYEEHPIYYNEKEMMGDYIKETLSEKEEDEEE